MLPPAVHPNSQDIWYLTEHSMVPHCAALLRNLTIIPALRALHPDLVLGDFSDVCTPILGDGLGVPRSGLPLGVCIC